jgi:hypothetical protein
MEYRYKPGDRVVVINEIRKNGDYYMRSGGQHPHANVICVSESTIRARKALEGTVVTILEYCRNRYIIKETNQKILWTDDMFVGLANEKECCCESLL